MRKKALIQALTGTTHIVCESIETDNTTGAMYYSTSGWKKSIPLRNLPEKSPKYDYSGPQLPTTNQKNIVKNGI